jgi:hypothetical protein
LPAKTDKVIFQYLQIGQRGLTRFQAGSQPLLAASGLAVSKQQRLAIFPMALRPTGIDNARVYTCDTLSSQIG